MIVLSLSEDEARALVGLASTVIPGRSKGPPPEPSQRTVAAAISVLASYQRGIEKAIRFTEQTLEASVPECEHW